MEWLQPAGAWAFAALIPLILLYLFRKKAKQTQVSSLLLWRKTENACVQSRPFRRLKNQLLLWLQILMVALLALALMRPITNGGEHGESVWIFDLSASMQTVDDQGVSRLQRAKQAAFKQLDGLGEGEKLTVLAAGFAIEQLFTQSEDRLEARRQLEALTATNGAADLESALALARAMKREMPELQITVFSDDPTSDLADTTLVSVGQGMPNRAIMDVRLLPEEGTAFARIWNEGAETQAELECLADGSLCDVRTVTLPENAQSGVRFTVPKDAQAVQVRFGNSDALTADDSRYAVNKPNNVRTALLVTKGNIFLQRALALDETLLIDLATFDENAVTEGYDLYIYDGALPKMLPNSGAIFAVDPKHEVLGIRPAKEQVQSEMLRSAPNENAHAICENLLLDEVAIKEGTPLSGGTPILMSGEETLLCVRETALHRVAVLGFDLHNSNLPLKADFPVLVQNLLRYLLPTPATAVTDAVCGQALPITVDVRAESAYVRTPSGKQAFIQNGYLNDTDEIGVYTLVQHYAQGDRETRFALHIPQAESKTLAVAGSSKEQEESAKSIGTREWTGWLLVLLFAVALLEWGVSRRAGSI